QGGHSGRERHGLPEDDGCGRRAERRRRLVWGLRQVQPADPAAHGLGEPDVAVRPDGDAPGRCSGRDARGELSERARGGEAADPASTELGEPEVAVRPGRDLLGATTDVGGDLGEDARGGDPADQAKIRYGEPEVAVRPGGDPVELTALREARGELGDDARRGDAGGTRISGGRGACTAYGGGPCMLRRAVAIARGPIRPNPAQGRGV